MTHAKDARPETARAKLPEGAVGIGLRWAHVDPLVARLREATGPRPDFVEVVPDNFGTRHDPLWDSLCEIAGFLPVRTHSLALDLAGFDPIPEDYLRTIRRVLDRFDVPYHTDHLCFTSAGGRHAYDLLPPVPTRRAVERTADRIRRVADALGRPLAVENVTQYLLPEGEMDPYAFLAEVAERADCGLLLDLNNIVVNARNHGFDPRGILERLPLSRVTHVHVAGGTYWEEARTWVDTHAADPDTDSLHLLAILEARIGPVPVVYERDSRLPGLDELLAETARLRRHRGTPGAPRTGAGGPARRDPKPRRAATSPRVPPAAPRHPDRARHEAALVGLLAAEADEGARKALVVYLGDPAPSGEARARMEVYRRLVRRTVEGAMAGLLPRARKARGASAFSTDVAAYLAGPGPRERILRREVGRFVAWACRTRWIEAPDTAAWARIEAAEVEAATAPRGADPQASVEPRLAPDRPVVLCRSLRLVDLADLADAAGEGHGGGTRRSEILRAPGYAVFRDAAGRVRRWELTSRAFRLLEALCEGTPLERAAPSAWPAGDENLADLETFLRDLAKAGVLLGIRPP